MAQGNRTAVLYHYFEKSKTYRDNFVFFLARAWRPDLQFFVVIAGKHSVDLPVRDNIHYLFTRNFGHDFGSYAAVTESGALDAFDRIIVVNCSVRGPFLPQYVTNCWTAPFLDLLNGDVHLCGSAINILHNTRPIHALYRQHHPEVSEPFSHVQSSAHAMTAECFAFLRDRKIYANAPGYDKDRAIVDCELAMSQMVRSNGWNISCVLPPYQALDYRAPHSDINPSTATGHPQAKGAYFGLTPHPFELVFVKTGWPVLTAEANEFYSLMALQHHPVASLEWSDAAALRVRLANSIGGPLASLVARPPRPAAPAVRRVPSRPLCLLVLGMHRSGTSALAGALTQLGVALPKSPMEPHFSNPRGFFESIPVRDFNDSVLAAAGSSWKDWRPIAPRWFASNKAEALLDDAVQLINEEFGTNSHFVLKDPRICRLLPFWRTVLERCSTDILALHTHRHPQEVAGSLGARYKFDPAFTHLLWLRHLLEAEAASRGLTRHFTSFAQLLDDPAGVTARIAKDIDQAHPISEVAEKLCAFISPALRNHRSPEEPQYSSLAPWYRDSLAIFDRWTRTGEDIAGQAQLDAIRAQFDGGLPAFAPFIVEKRIPATASA